MPWGQKFAGSPTGSTPASPQPGSAAPPAASTGRGSSGSTTPRAFELVGRVGEGLTVYDVVDDYAEQVGADTRRRRFVADADEAAASRSQVVFATTNGLYERQLARNPETHLVRNGARLRALLAHERNRARGACAAGARGRFRGEPAPRRRSTSTSSRPPPACRPEWSSGLVGPARRERARRGSAASRLSENVHVLGFRPYDELPAYVSALLRRLDPVPRDGVHPELLAAQGLRISRGRQGRRRERRSRSRRHGARRGARGGSRRVRRGSRGGPRGGVDRKQWPAGASWRRRTPGRRGPSVCSSLVGGRLAG